VSVSACAEPLGFAAPVSAGVEPFGFATPVSACADPSWFTTPVSVGIDLPGIAASVSAGVITFSPLLPVQPTLLFSGAPGSAPPYSDNLFPPLPVYEGVPFGKAFLSIRTGLSITIQPYGLYLARINPCGEQVAITNRIIATIFHFFRFINSCFLFLFMQYSS
jgi:hypothetical protein